MKVLVIVPLIITIEVPAKTTKDLYDEEGALRREDLLDRALAKVTAGQEVEMPEADNEGVIFLDDREYELADELDERH